METEARAATIININGVEYDASDASSEAMAAIQDASTIQTEMNRLKVSYDIVSLARQSIIEKIETLITNGDSGLTILPMTEETLDTNETASTEA